MRILFVGASKFGVRCLDELTRLDCCEVVGAVTAPHSFAISYRPQGVVNVLHGDVAGFCAARGIDYRVMRRNMQEPQLFDTVQGWKPDACVVVGWYHMIPRAWLDFVPAYGLHASLLPDYSGGAPLVWAIINGEELTGITLFKFAAGIDNGPIVGQLPTPIAAHDTIATVYERIETLGVELLREHLPRLAAGTAVLTPQDETRRRLMLQRSPEDGRIEWTQSSRRIHDFIRAQTHPYPGAFGYCHGRKISIWASTRVTAADFTLAPGALRNVDGRIVVGCGDGGLLELTRVGADDAETSAADWFARWPGDAPFQFEA